MNLKAGRASETLAYARTHTRAHTHTHTHTHTPPLARSLALSRTHQGWPMTEFSDMMALSAAYLIFVGLGSAIMQKSPSLHNMTFPLRFIYNLMQVGLCSYMTVEAGVLAYRNSYSLTPCNAFSNTNPPVGSLLWLFYISKILDFADTFFIVMGKKWTQLTFLHVYHHLTIFMFYWLNANIGYDGDIYFTILLNGFIHSVM